MVLNVDVAPTLLELAAVQVPGGFHGHSFVPLLEGRNAPWRDGFLYEYYEYPAELGGVGAVRPRLGSRRDREPRLVARPVPAIAGAAGEAGAATPRTGGRGFPRPSAGLAALPRELVR
jgi:N-sulphoglucosamine sulphohydrolase, C-terminal